MSKRKILFVCTGNICRSPMAEHLFRHRAGENSAWEALSAGLAGCYGLPASGHAISVCDELGIEMRAHRSQPVTRELVEAADVIVVMTGSHRDQIEALFPDVSKDKVFLMKGFHPVKGDPDVVDPIGMSATMYRSIRDEIDAAMPGLIEFLGKLA